MTVPLFVSQKPSAGDQMAHRTVVMVVSLGALYTADTHPTLAIVMKGPAYTAYN